MRTKSAPAIHLKDYQPPAYSIRDVHLDVVLDPEDTKVRSSLTVARNADTAADEPLVLHGDELKLGALSVNGKPARTEDFTETPDGLEVRNLPTGKLFKIEIYTELAPAHNRKLMGLYQSKGVYCTQCEAEGFRRITYFPDRPDVLSVYTVRLEADQTSCPQLLSNGNLIKKGKLPKGRHYAIWHDPHPKPCYLFAMVGGALDTRSDNFKTASGRKVKLNIYVETGKAEMARFAMDALKRSMVWDEQVYGREYDLDIFNIVAVSDFNMGAMENKGLNVFNDKYVLANPDVATDADYMHIEAIIAHEYFHNWTGNRITCRDWFQLCLKEGLTVYRDQEFSADQRSKAVQRIHQVRVLKGSQFPEDAGPLAHSVRPAAYQEINNFYTATVYQKGAELVRMLATLVGPEAYRKSTDLYFKRHDGRAAVVEDWLSSFEDAAGTDLTRFSRWYQQAGTPVVTVTEKFEKKPGRYTLNFEQNVPPTPGQSKKKPVPIPIRFGLINGEGDEVEPVTKSDAVHDDVILIDAKSVAVEFEGLSTKPSPSLLRGFSAPVRLEFNESDDDRLHRAKYDTDLYNRWEALNGYATSLLKMVVRGDTVDTKPFVKAVVAATFDKNLEPEFRAQILTLPTSQDIARELGVNVDPDAVERARKSFMRSLGKALFPQGMKTVRGLHRSRNGESEIDAAGRRSLKNALLPLLVLAKAPGALEFTTALFKNAKTMTDRLAALTILLHCQSDAGAAEDALEKLYKRYGDNHLVVDKWFGIQAGTPGAKGLRRVRALSRHPDFTLENPNRARALLAPFAAGNITGFHRADGSGYDFFVDKIIELDRINPQIAARLLALMNNWRIFEPGRRAKAKDALKRVARSKGLSRDVGEIVDKALN